MSCSTPSGDRETRFAASGKDRRKEISGQLRTGNSPGSYTPHAAYALGYTLPAHFTWGGFAIVAGGMLLFVGLIAAVLILGWRPIR